MLTLKEGLLQTLRGLRVKNGLYYASSGSIMYKKCWIRDSFYESLPELFEDKEKFKQTYQTILNYYIKMERQYEKFSWLIKDTDLTDEKVHRFIHPRCTPELEQINEPWGQLQLESPASVLYGIWLGQSHGIDIIRDDEDRNIINLIIQMFEKLKYYQLDGNNVWEERRELMSSATGIIIAGLTAIKLLGFKVNQDMLDKGHETLNRLLPRESDTKNVDLTLLMLIYPFDIVSPQIARQIIANVEAELLREKGVIRYKGDVYYMKDGIESPWSFGLTYLALAHNILGDTEKAKYYLNIAKGRTVEEGFNVPEMYCGKDNEIGVNNPLGWSNAMLILAIQTIEENKSIHNI